jgi:hypothetical protein
VVTTPFDRQYTQHLTFRGFGPCRMSAGPWFALIHVEPPHAGQYGLTFGARLVRVSFGFVLSEMSFSVIPPF